VSVIDWWTDKILALRMTYLIFVDAGFMNQNSMIQARENGYCILNRKCILHVRYTGP